jgi:hypothetical protein
MTNDGTNGPSGNANAKQIGSERAGAPPETPKKDYFEVYIEIISTLLKNEVRTETEIADNCGYAKEGKDKCAHVHRQIKKLALKWNYIEYIDGPRPGYRIRRDPETICQIYDDKKYKSIRQDFQTSPWLTDLIIMTYLPEYGSDKEFLEDVEKMLKTSRLMFEWHLRGTTHAHQNATLGEIPGPSPPVVKTPGIDNALLKWLTRKCSIYDLFLTCVLLEYRFGMEAGTPSGEVSRVWKEMNQKCLDMKLAAINYVLSFTMMQNLARCADATRLNDGQVPPFFNDIGEKYKAIVQRLHSKDSDTVSLAAAAQDMGKWYIDIIKSLDARSPVYSLTGEILPMGPQSLEHARKTVFKKTDKGEKRKD